VKCRFVVLLLLILSLPVSANQIKQLRVAPTTQKVRMVFDLVDRPDYSYTIDTDKNSLIVEFHNIFGDSFSVPKTKGCEGFLKSLRRSTFKGGVVQVEFMLADNVKPQLFTLTPQENYHSHRLVIDVVPGTLVGKKEKLSENKTLISTTEHFVNAQGNTSATTSTKSSIIPVANASTNTAETVKTKPVAGRVIQLSDLISKEELSAPDKNDNDEPDNSPDTSKAVMPSNGQPFIVAIDAGHGGKDPGAIGPHRTYEKTVTLGIAKKLANLIDRQPGMKAVLTRNTDRFIELDERSAIARQKKARLLISIHADSGGDDSVRGASVWILSAKRVDREMDKLLVQKSRHTELLGGAGKVIAETEPNPYLAQTILDLSWDNSRSEGYDIGRKVLRRIGQVASLHKKRPEHASLAVLKAPDIPSLLIETGFISNSLEEKLLASSGYQDKLAKAIFSGVMDYYGTTLPKPGGTFVKTTNPSLSNKIADKKHVVKTGESLSGLANLYGVTQNAIRSKNRLKSDNLLIGQVIIIPSS